MEKHMTPKQICEDVELQDAHAILDCPEFKSLLKDCCDLARQGKRQSRTYKNDELKGIATRQGFHKALAISGLMWIEPWHPVEYNPFNKQLTSECTVETSTFTFSW